MTEMEDSTSLGAGVHFANCSYCHQRSQHRLQVRGLITRNVYICARCERQTLRCRIPACMHMTRGALTRSRPEEEVASPTFAWDDEFCAEHDGTIYSFERLSMRLADIHQIGELFIRDSVNVVRVAKYAGIAAAGAGLAAGVVITGGAAAPFAAAIGSTGILGAAGTGVAISSLTGAALTSASLAAIGGTMAAGTGIITAVGAALGGINGGVIAGTYHADDSTFAIRRLNYSKAESRTVFVNGFIERDNETFEEWTLQQLDFDNRQNLYGVNWSSKTRAELGRIFIGGVGSSAAIRALARIAKVGGLRAAKGLNPLSWLALFGEIVGNPWHSTMIRAAKAGVQLAEAISRTDGKIYTLVGHSLGCRVIYYALQALATKEVKYINNVLLLGGAVGRDDAKAWLAASNAIGGRIINCFSRHDVVLDKLYRTANAGLSDPIGVRPISVDEPRIANIDCSDLVDSHFAWKPEYAAIVNRVRQQLT